MANQSEQVAHADLVGESGTTLHGHASPSLNQCGAAYAPVNFNKQQATSLVIENRTSDPASPVNGQIWLRTDL